MTRRTKRAVGWTLSAVLIVLLLGFLGFVFSGVYNVAATQPHTAVAEWTLEKILERSAEVRADHFDGTASYDSSMVRSGFEHFRADCVTCHGAPGVARPDYAAHMIPEPPPLREAATRWSDEELFWIVRNGIKMSGMPAWGPLHADSAIWGIVGFVRQLAQMDSATYAEMEAAAVAAENSNHQHREDSAGSNTNSSNSSAEVAMTDDLLFEPQIVRIRPGERVVWRNTSQVTHTVTADPEEASDPRHVQLPEGADTFDSGFIDPGGTYSRTFEIPGEYRYFCIPHEGMGMLGRIIVEG